MSILDYVVIGLYFLGLIGVSVLMSRRIKSSADMFIAGRNSSWALSGMSTYMTIFSASTFVVWGGVAYRSGIVPVLVANLLGIAFFFVGKWVAPKWRQIKINSPGEFTLIRFGKGTLDLYTYAGIVGKGVHAAVSLYAVSIVMSTLTGINVSYAIIILGIITLVYTVLGGFLAVLMTDVIQFGVLMAVVIFMVPLAIHLIGGMPEFFACAPEGFFVPSTPEYPWFWLFLWFGLNFFMMGGEWPFVQRYISVPTAKDAKKSSYLVGILYLITPIIWYFPAMAYHVYEIQQGIPIPEGQALVQHGQQAYILMSQTVLMKGMVGVMLAAMISATLSCVSGTLNVFANVFTYDIWSPNHEGASDRRKITVGRLFTLFFGLSILIVALLVPYAGGAEKVVVTILTMVISPLYIPSIWGLFSKRVTGRQVIWTMVITYTIGIIGKFGFPAMGIHIHPQVFEATVGMVIPCVLMLVFELYHRSKGITCEGYDKIQEITDVAAADIEPSPEMKKAVKSYSLLAVRIFLYTLIAIAVLLIGVLIFECPQDVFVKNTMVISIIAIILITVTYFVWARIDSRKQQNIKA